MLVLVKAINGIHCCRRSIQELIRIALIYGTTIELVRYTLPTISARRILIWPTHYQCHQKRHGDATKILDQVNFLSNFSHSLPVFWFHNRLRHSLVVFVIFLIAINEDLVIDLLSPSPSPSPESQQRNQSNTNCKQPEIEKEKLARNDSIISIDSNSKVTVSGMNNSKKNDSIKYVSDELNDKNNVQDLTIISPNVSTASDLNVKSRKRVANKVAIGDNSKRKKVTIATIPIDVINKAYERASKLAYDRIMSKATADAIMETLDYSAKPNKRTKETMCKSLEPSVNAINVNKNEKYIDAFTVFARHNHDFVRSQFRQCDDAAIYHILCKWWNSIKVDEKQYYTQAAKRLRDERYLLSDESDGAVLSADEAERHDENIDVVGETNNSRQCDIDIENSTFFEDNTNSKIKVLCLLPTFLLFISVSHTLARCMCVCALG